MCLWEDRGGKPGICGGFTLSKIFFVLSVIKSKLNIYSFLFNKSHVTDWIHIISNGFTNSQRARREQVQPSAPRLLQVDYPFTDKYKDHNTVLSTLKHLFQEGSFTGNETFNNVNNLLYPALEKQVSAGVAMPICDIIYRDLLFSKILKCTKVISNVKSKMICFLNKIVNSKFGPSNSMLISMKAQLSKSQNTELSLLFESIEKDFPYFFTYKDLKTAVDGLKAKMKCFDASNVEPKEDFNVLWLIFGWKPRM